MKNKLKKFYWVLSTQLGMNPIRFLRSLRGIPRYFGTWKAFRKDYHGEMNLQPCLYDWFEESGDFKSEYFIQDLYVAQKVFAKNPNKHVDIGSRIDGFIAHVASYRELEIFDIREMSAAIPNVTFKQADFMLPPIQYSAYTDSLSCLHTLEHFGLGRYGDPINPNGSEIGFSNIAQLLKPNGIFYLSVPIGRERVEFNAHRVFNPLSILSFAKNNFLTCIGFAWIPLGKGLIESCDIANDTSKLCDEDYALGIFTFCKHG